MNCEPIDCPICFDLIGEKNNITTECGHKFHASCLMTNISRNGFGCPCCRAVMADEPDDATEVDDEQWVFDETEVDDDSDDGSDELFADDDDALRGLRLFTNLLEGNEHDQEDAVAEYQYNEGRTNVHVPTFQEFTAALRAKGVTYEQLVANAMMDLDEYNHNIRLMADLDDRTNDLWEKMRTYINSYSHGIEEEPIVASAEPMCDLHISPIQQIESYEIEFAVGGGFTIAEDPCEINEDWRDTIWNEIDVLWCDYQAQPKMPMIHV